MSRRIAMPLLAATLVVATAAAARAEITRVEIQRRADIGASGVEKIVGTAYFAVDPQEAHNRVIVNIDRAPVNKSGRVEFSADFYALRLKDAAKTNGITLVDVVNRGRKTVVTGFTRDGSNDPVSEADLGDRFLLDRGFTLVWIGWEFDVRRQNGLMGIDVPSAQGVSGTVAAEMIPSATGEQQTFGDLLGYLPAEPGAVGNTLTVRDSQFGKAEVVERSRWTLDGNVVTLREGFQAGRLYRLSYRPAEWPVSGLGLVAFRDITSWMKHAPDAVLRTQQALAFGSSQSGRFLRSFLYEGMNADEQGRLVYDAVWMHIAGAGQLDLNAQGATPTSLSMYESTRFPYANQAMRDPVSGRTDGLIDNDRARAAAPKMFFTNTSVEYWGGGRSAALIHTSPDGARDLTLDDQTRVYYLTGAQHGPARFPTAIGQGQQPDNPLEYVWTMRALMVAMEAWLREGTPPPPSRYPRLADGSLVPAAALAFPAIPWVQSPSLIEGNRRDSQAIPFLVPQVDADGNEQAGVRTPESLVPLATYTGWNFRNLATGGPKLVVWLLGSRMPFPITPGAAAAAHDPRRSIAERYPSREVYLSSAGQAADTLVRERYLLPADRSRVMERVEQQWDSVGR